MGTENQDISMPVHKVTLDDFYISKYEVTVGEFKKFVEETGYQTLAERMGSTLVYNFVDDSTRGWEEKKGVSWNNPGFEQADDHPVTSIAWEDAQAYTSWLSEKTDKSYRLPTEAEWEYAARNRGQDIRYPWGNEEYDGSQANFINSSFPFPWAGMPDDPFTYTASVDAFTPNKLGLYNMAGNVWEWCLDRYGPYPDQPVTNPTGSDTSRYRVMRGASWFNSHGNDRTRRRNWDDPKKRYYNLGFRLALPVR